MKRYNIHTTLTLKSIYNSWNDLKIKRNQKETDVLAILPKFTGVIPEYEIVVARYTEDLSWFNTIDEKINITVYNKGDAYTQNLPERTNIIPLPNIGRESHTYAMHCSLRYDTLATYTIFTTVFLILPDPYTLAVFF